MKYSRKAVKAALLCGTALAAAAAGFGASAQPGDSTVIQEVIVTAQRRSERLENVPASITAVTPQSLEKAGVVDPHDLGRITPGVQINFAGAYTQPAIRGVTTLTNGTNIENNVAVYVDGFYDPNASGINADFANLASIEVLKGPQGTLYGRNATGGAILVNTLAPSKTYTGKFEVGYSSFNTDLYNAYLSGPITDRVRFSLAGHVRNSDGYIAKADPTDTSRTNGDAAPLKQQSLRFKLEGDVTKDLTATLGLNYTMVNDVRGLLFSGFEHSPYPVSARAPRFGTAAYNRKTEGLLINREGTLKLAYNTPIGMLTSYTGFAHRVNKSSFDVDGTYLDAIYSVTSLPQDTFQQAVDYNITSIDKLDLVVGGLYYHNQIKMKPETLLYLNGRLITKNFFEERTRAFAFYVDGTYHLTDKLSLNLGGRYSSEEKRAEFSSRLASGVVTVPLIDKKETWHKFTPRATVRYEIEPRTNVYASYTQGFRSGQWNAGGATNPALFFPTNPEKIKAYEVGFKTARSRVRFDAAAFYYDYKDLNVAVTVPNPICPAGQLCNAIVAFANAPGAKVYGVDGQIVVTPIDKLNVRVGAAWVHGRYNGFPNAVGTGVNATNTLNVASQVQDWSHQQMARAPNFSGNIGVDYEIDNVVGGTLALAGNFNYTDSYVINNASLYGPLAGARAKDQRFRQGAYSLLSLQATWTDPTDHYTVTVFGNNVTDKTYRMLYSGNTSSGDYSIPGEPRSYGVKAGYRF